jgi:hypothetical protein
MVSGVRVSSHSVPLWPTLGVVAALAAALALRFYAVEPRAIGFACQALVPPWWCGVRHAFVLSFQWGLWGGVALVLGVLALVGRSRGAAVAALIAGAAALTLYNPETGAVGFLLGLLSALRR